MFVILLILLPICPLITFSDLERGHPFGPQFEESSKKHHAYSFFFVEQKGHPHSNLLGLFPPSRFSCISYQEIQQPPSLQAEQVSLHQLLDQRDRFHEKLISIQGMVSQPELHVDSSSLFIDFVFVLRDGSDSIIVYGKHDRTQGDIQIQMGRTVVVTGIFWKERLSQGIRLENNVEATSVEFSPGLTPHTA